MKFLVKKNKFCKKEDCKHLAFADVLANLRSEENKVTVSIDKEKLPAAFYAGDFSGAGLSESDFDISSFTGLVWVDIDNLDKTQQDKIVKECNDISYLCYSTSTDGVHLVIVIDDASRDAMRGMSTDEFKKEWFAIQKHICFYLSCKFDITRMHNGVGNIELPSFVKPANLAFARFLSNDNTTTNKTEIIKYALDSKSIINGNRNNTLYSVVNSLISRGIWQDDMAMSGGVICDYFNRLGVGNIEIARTVNSTKSRHGRKCGDNYFSQVNLEIQNEINFKRIFELTEEDKKLHINYHLLFEFLALDGFAVSDEGTYNKKLINIQNNIYRYIDVTEILKRIQSAAKHVDSKSGGNFYFNLIFKNSKLDKLETYINGLPLINITTLNSNDSVTFIPFTNGVIKITTNRTELIEYKDIEQGYIYEGDIVPHYIELGEYKRDVFNDFLKNVSGGNENIFENAIGYLCKGKYRPRNKKIIVLTDANKNEDIANGRTGKTLIGDMIGLSLNSTCTIGGKNFDATKNFAFQKYSGQNNIIINDLAKGFDGSSLFDVYDADFTVERKYEHPKTYHRDDAPEFILTSNYSVNDGGGSSSARYYEIPLVNYYNCNFSPENEFGEKFWDDWVGTKSWKRNNFYLFLFGCIRKYKNEGLLPLTDSMKQINTDRLAVKNVSDELFSAFDSYFDAHGYVNTSSSIIIDHITSKGLISKDKLTSHYITKKLPYYLDSKGIKYEKKKNVKIGDTWGRGFEFDQSVEKKDIINQQNTEMKKDEVKQGSYSGSFYNFLTNLDSLIQRQYRTEVTYKEIYDAMEINEHDRFKEYCDDFYQCFPNTVILHNEPKKYFSFLNQNK